MAFERVSLNTWLNSNTSDFTCERADWEALNLPVRGTNRSAGYDFKSPFEILVTPGKQYVMPTGIKWNPEDSRVLAKTITYEREDTYACVNRHDTNYEVCQNIKVLNVVLQMYPRSSLGIKYGFTFSNTTPIIDADYYNNPDNEGHIYLGFTCLKEFKINKGDKICQAIMVPYLTFNDHVDTERTGGIGSTGE